MSLPSFFSRVADSLRPVAEVDPDMLAAKLAQVRLQLHLEATDPAAVRAYLLAVNLAARLYPRIGLSIDADLEARDEGGGPAAGSAATDQARLLALRINPNADVHVVDHATPDDTPTDDDLTVRLTFASATPVATPGTIAATGEGDTTGSTEPPVGSDGSDGSDGSEITVSASGWSVFVDHDAATSVPPPPDEPAVTSVAATGHPLAWLAAAAFGMSEVFRRVFADELGPRGRHERQPGSLNLITAKSPANPAVLIDPTVQLAEPEGGDSARAVDIGEVYLVGAGAIGQAAVYALASVDLTGTLHVVDPESVTLSNLQRYVLTDDSSVDAVKVDLVQNTLLLDAIGDGDQRAPSLSVQPFRGRWGDDTGHVGAERVLVALDTPNDRIAVAASIPLHAFNAWTQVADLGWSRHELFGEQPCLACLYYPDRARPSEHELIAEALGQHPLRVLGYLTHGAPIGMPLPDIPNLATIRPPGDAQRWLQVSLMSDLVAAGSVGEQEQGAWANKTIGVVYRDGICAGGLLPVGDVPGDVLVPLAHQSVLAGVMLAAELLWSVTPELQAQRDAAVEHRFDVLRGFPQVVARPRTRTKNCLCSDPDYLASHANRHPPTRRTPAPSVV